MSVFTRKLLGLVLACVIAYGLMTAIAMLARDAVSSQVSTGAGIETAMEQGRVPFNVLILVLGGWLLAGYIGGTIAYRFSGDQTPAFWFAAIAAATILYKLMQMPHPTWMWIGGLAGVPLFALGAANQRITLRSR